MAALAKHLTFLFLLYLASSLQIQARESQFFSKTTRVDQVKEPEVNGNGVPSLKQEPTTFTPQAKNGHGLYGTAPEEVSPATAAGKSPAKFPTDEFTAENYEEKESNPGYVNTEYPNKQYGMSDTRFMENGKYFYNVKGNGNGYGNRNGNGENYQSWKGNGEVLDTSGVVDTRNKYRYGGYGNNERNKYYNYGGYGNSERSKYNYGGYENSGRGKYNYGGYGNNENGDEFNTSMEGYQNQEEFEP